jgi:hypothetical protein
MGMRDLETTARVLAAFAVLVDRQALQLGEQGLGPAAGFGMLRHHRGQRAAVAPDHEVSIALSELRQTAQLDALFVFVLRLVWVAVVVPFSTGAPVPSCLAASAGVARNLTPHREHESTTFSGLAPPAPTALVVLLLTFLAPVPWCRTSSNVLSSRRPSVR